MLPHQTHRFREVAVVAHHHGAIVRIEPGIIHEMRSQVHVGTLFLGLHYVRRAPGPLWTRKRHPNRVTQEMPVIDLYLRPELLNCPQIDVLPL